MDTPTFDDIKNKELALVMWDWSQFHDCFPSDKMSLSDIDGIMERNGYFLIIETKRPNVKIPTGQWILLRTLSKHENITVMIVWGHKNQPIALQFVGQKEQIRIDLQGMKKYIKEWFDKVDKRPRYLPNHSDNTGDITDEQGFKWLQSLSSQRLIGLMKWIVDKLEGLCS